MMKDLLLWGINGLLETGLQKLYDTVVGTAASIVAGGMPLEEWVLEAGKIGRESICTIRQNQGLIYIGGYIKFRLSPDVMKDVITSYELYFQDASGGWYKAEQSAKIRAISFDKEALAKISAPDGIAFELNMPG